MNLPVVDVVVLTRDERPIRAEVQSALTAQQGVVVRIHRIVGTALAGDATRHVTIARARNRAVACGESPWVMFVDDDIVLPSNAVARLFSELTRRPTYAALGANVLGDSQTWNLAGHVGMGATMFRRSALAQIQFRWEPGKCECLVCCQDLRRRGMSIAYLDGLWAEHLRIEPTTSIARSPEGASMKSHGVNDVFVDCATGSESSETQCLGVQHRLSKSTGCRRRQPVAQKPNLCETFAAHDPSRNCPKGQILVAFNRRHFDKFRDQFLRSLRAHGNQEQISIVGYGLYPSEQRILSLLPGVNVRNYAVNGVMPPIRRLLDFQTIVRNLPPNTPVAYWDAGDVVFQSSLKKLWQTVADNPNRLLAVREPKSYPHNAAVNAWSLSIHDANWRNRIFEMMKRSPFLNSGFAAGTARVMLRYLESAHRMRHGIELNGSSDWGDQMALNVYCHSQSDAWKEVEAGWNYCVHDQPRGEFVVQPDGRMASQRGTPIYVAHGNARSLRKLSILR